MVPTNNDKSASPQPGGSSVPKKGRKCPRCKRFGTFAPNSIVCDNCQGTLSLGFVIAVTVVVGGDR